MKEPIRISIQLTAALEDVSEVDVSALGKRVHDFAETLTATRSNGEEHKIYVNTYISATDSFVQPSF